MRWKPGPSELKFPVFKIERIDVEFWSAGNRFLNVGNYSVFGKTRKTQPVVVWNCVLCDKLIILCDKLAQTFINLYFCFQTPHASNLYKKITDFKRRLHRPSLWSTVLKCFQNFGQFFFPFHFSLKRNGNVVHLRIMSCDQPETVTFASNYWKKLAMSTVLIFAVFIGAIFNCVFWENRC